MGLCCADRTLLAVWRLDANEDRVYLPIKGEVRVLYLAASDVVLSCSESGLTVTPPRQYTAALLLISPL